MITNFNNFVNATPSFFVLSARISPKENSGASGGFLPKPLLLRLRHPNSKKISRVFCQILSPKNSFGKTESALVPPPARFIEGRTPKEKHPFLFQKKFHPRQTKKVRSVFLSGLPRLCEAVAGRFIPRRDWFQKRFEFCTMNTAD